MLKKKNCALLGLGILLGGIYEFLKDKKRNEEIRNLKRRINRLGRCHNEFVMYQGEYNDKSGLVKFGFIKSGLFPNAEWNTGIEVRYHQIDANYENKIYMIRLGSSIQVKMDY